MNIPTPFYVFPRPHQTPRSKAVIAAGRTAFPRHRAQRWVLLQLRSWAPHAPLHTVPRCWLHIDRRTDPQQTTTRPSFRRPPEAAGNRRCDRACGHRLELLGALHRNLNGTGSQDKVDDKRSGANGHRDAVARRTANAYIGMYVHVELCKRNRIYLHTSGVDACPASRLQPRGQSVSRIAVVAAGRPRVTFPETQAVSVSKIQTREQADALVGRNLSRGME
jgi:hypothetical protein